MKRTLLIFLIIASPLMAGENSAFELQGVRSGMTKQEAQTALYENDHYVFDSCTKPGSDGSYSCRWNVCAGYDWCPSTSDKMVRSMAVTFSPTHRVAGLALILSGKDSYFVRPGGAGQAYEEIWKAWQDSISEQMGEPTKKTGKISENVIRQTEWLVTDTKGKKLLRVRLSALSTGNLFIDFSDAKAGAYWLH